MVLAGRVALRTRASRKTAPVPGRLPVLPPYYHWPAFTALRSPRGGSGPLRGDAARAPQPGGAGQGQDQASGQCHEPWHRYPRMRRSAQRGRPERGTAGPGRPRRARARRPDPPRRFGKQRVTARLAVDGGADQQPQRGSGEAVRSAAQCGPGRPAFVPGAPGGARRRAGHASSIRNQPVSAVAAIALANTMLLPGNPGSSDTRDI